MKNGIQSRMESAGDNACYLFCLINIAEEYTGVEFDFWTVAYIASVKKYISIKWEDLKNDNNFFVDNPSGILQLLTGKNWTVVKSEKKPTLSKKDYLVQHYSYTKNGVYHGHFRRPDFDSLQNSQCVKIGKIDSYRIATVQE